ncbi:HD domain-containing protein [Methanolobus mangrovi]|uniref:HD domain-containing protein n=1 Tax=Methanolobus mangrovi TaxID=3072977 RepID=A0AA51YHB4_9EURY|nr:HD domain-containing protein [Methanolobus mangrovi]WMW22982.1 HD domain-containing protein [Methanolobus mangrovi]
MKEEDFLVFNEWFFHYVGSFHTDDRFIRKNIKLKEEHSLRVCVNSSLIAISEDLDERDHYLAKTIGLLHDIGRFEQIRKYRTFNDSESENHALLGVKILKAEGVLSGLPHEEQEIIFTAIKNHNVHILPEELDQRTLFHSKIIRDADKLDIYKVLTDHYAIREMSPNPALYHGLPDTFEYNRDLLEDIFNNRVASVNKVATCNDMNLTRLAWLFDLNFVETVILVRKRDYIKKLVATLPQNSEIDELHDYLNRYVDSILSISKETYCEC